MAERLVISGAREHNLKDVHLDLPRDQLIVITGLSGSGKSSLAFDTIYAEGQRRYVESLSAYARQFLGQMDKPDVDFIEGLSPAISIDQKSASRNPRSTVGTITEVYDYLRLLFARIGVPHDPETGERLIRQTPQQIVDRILEMEPGTRFQVLAPVVRGRKGTYDTLLADLAGQGFARAIVDGELIELADFAGATGLSGGADGLELARYEMHDIAVVVDRLILREGVERRLTDSVETALRLAGGLAEIDIVSGPKLVFSQHLARPSDGKSFEELAPRNFSFNSPYGACAHCDGLGTVFEVDPQLVVPDPDATLATGAITPWSDSRSRYYPRLLQAVCEEYGIPRDVPWRELTPRQHDMLLYAKGVKGRVQVRYQNRFGRRRVYQARYEGIVPHLMRRHNETDSDASRENIEGYMRQVPCPDCGGARLNPLALAVTVDGRTIHDLCAMSIAEAAKALAEMNLDDRDSMIAEQVLKEIRSRLGFLLDVGLDYLNLSRSAATLAGGEAQRIRLASQVGSGLVGVLYVLDEPSIGLHQRDNRRLIETLVRMRDLGNTVMVVEHDEETIRVADHVVDIGPGAGEHGGAIVHSGPLEGLLELEESITGQYLSGERRIAVPQMRRTGDGTRLVVRGARENNLAGHRRGLPIAAIRVRDRGVGFGQVVAGQRDPAPGADAAHLPVQDPARAPHPPRRRRPSRQGDLHRPVAHRPDPPVQPGHLHRGVRPRAQAVRQHGRVPGAGLHAGAVLVQREGRALRGLPGRRHHPHRDALPARRVRALRGVQGQAVQPRDPRGPPSRVATIADVLDMPCIDEAIEHFADQPAVIARHIEHPATTSAWATCGLGQPALDALRAARHQRMQAGAARWASDPPSPHHLHPRRAHHRAALRGCAQAAGRPRPVGGPGQHGRGDRAQPGRGQDGRLDHRPRARGRLGRGPHRGRGHPRAGGRSAREPHRPIPALDAVLKRPAAGSIPDAPGLTSSSTPTAGSSTSARPRACVPG